MDKDIVLNGVHIGEHSFEPDKVIEEINERCIKPGFNFVTIRTRYERLPQETFIKWAEYLAKNKIYFIFLYTIQNMPEEIDSQFDRETVEKMREVAGEYFIGDMIGETGTHCACIFPGYFDENGKSGRKFTNIIHADDMQSAHLGYVSNVSKCSEIDNYLGVPGIVSVEATSLHKYNAEAGIKIPMLELMCGNPDLLVSFLRGTARAVDSKLWGTYIAHEWYGGMRHDDILKRKRLELGYKYAYLAGTNALCLESGDEAVDSYGHSFDENSEICRDYKNALTYIQEYINSDSRPKGGPKVKIAFVSGLHDSWGGFGGSTAWNQFGREEWGYNEAEHSWRIAEEVGSSRQWHEVTNYGFNDLSSTPAYGMYDVIPIEADLDKLSRYEYLIFLGWNSMTDENIDKLTEYVRGGGKLLMSTAHLNKSVVRGGKLELISNDKLEKLFGAKFTGKIRRSNGGIKFNYTSLDDNVLYPGTKSFICDPVCSAGYVDYAEFELSGGTKTAFVSENFADTPEDREKSLPAVIENRVGDGVATLVTSTNYPGHPALYPLYRALTREIITASARNCELKVISSDRLRYAVYEGNKIYLLNTDYDLPITVKIIYNGKETMVTLDSLELKAITL